jgi:hypothetical protein
LHINVGHCAPLLATVQSFRHFDMYVIARVAAMQK